MDIQHNFNQNNPLERTVEENWKFFVDSVDDLVTTHVPHKTYTGSRGPPWLTPVLKKKIRKKEKLYIRAKLSGCVDHRTQYTDYQNIVNKAIRKSKRDNIAEIKKH